MGSVIVIGHAPSLHGKGLGDYIDSHDNVIRLVEYLNYQSSKEDYGEKTTYHFIYSHYVRYIKYNQDHVWRESRENCQIPVETWVGWNMQSKVDEPLNPEIKRHFQQRFEGYNVILFEEFFAEMRREYSKLDPQWIAMCSGTSATLLAMHRLRPKFIKLIGCDNLYKGDNENYIGSVSYLPQKDIRTVAHDFKKEKLFLQNYADKKGVKLIWEMLN